MTDTFPPEAHDFDFLHGHWTVTNRKLKARGVGAPKKKAAAPKKKAAAPKKKARGR